MPVTIKRYPNRKLYNTQTKRYLTLDEIGGIVAGGEDITVVEHPSGENITLRILSQVIFEQSKRTPANMQQGILAGLIRTRADAVSTFQRFLKGYTADKVGLDREVRHRIEELVQRGRLSEELAEEIIAELILIDFNWYVNPSGFDGHVGNLLDKAVIPTRNDYQRLIDQVDELGRKLEELSQV